MLIQRAKNYGGSVNYNSGWKRASVGGFIRKSFSHGFRHRMAQLSAFKKGRFIGRSSHFGL